MNNIKAYCDAISRGYDKTKKVLEVEAAETAAIMDHFGKVSPEVYAIELEKSGRLKTLKHRINERLDLIHTNYTRMIEEFDVIDIFKVFTDEDLDSDTYAKLKSVTAKKTAVSKLKSAAKKAFEAKLLELYDNKDMVSEIIRVINDARKLAEERKHELSDLGAIAKKPTSKFFD